MPKPEILLQTHHLRIARYTISAQDAVVPHYHTHVDDFIYCLMGQLTITTPQGVTHLAAPHSSTTITAGTPHQVTTHDTVAVYLLIQHGGVYDFIPCDAGDIANHL